MTEAYDNLTLEWLADCLRKYENKATGSIEIGPVVAINADGSYQVRLNKSDVTTRCEKYCAASTGDVVAVSVEKGRCRAIARRGGEGSSSAGADSVTVIDSVVQGSLLPVTSNAVYVEMSNITALLRTI